MPIETKICGLNTPESVAAATQHGARYLGFVFFPKSPRNITPEKAALLMRSIPSGCASVAVTVDMPDEQIEAMLKQFRPSYIQLHGQESSARVKEIKQKFGLATIKAIRVSSGDDIAKGNAYDGLSDMLLFDAKAPDSVLPGGNGLAFDWQLLKGRQFTSPWFLSGGLHSGNVAEAVAISGAKLVDASSSLEHPPGQKDPTLIKEFLNTTNSL